MAITGNLKTFYLSSLLQLLSNDKKTGILELTDGNDIVQVYLRDGTIINAFGSSRVDRLTNYLRSEGLITEEQLQKCMKISAHTEKKIGLVLVEQGFISPEQLESLLHRQIEQTLYSLFLWEKGEFQYRDQNFDLSGQIITSFDTMQVVLEASRRVDEISEIKKRVPLDHEVIKANPDCSDKQKTKLNTVERAVLSLVNGHRTIKNVIADSGYDELKVYKTLFSLIASGLILEDKKRLKRSEDIHEEIGEPAETGTTDSTGQEENRETTAQHTEPDGERFDKPGDTQSIFKGPEDIQEETTKPQHTDAGTADTAVLTENRDATDKNTGPTRELVDTPIDTQPDHNEPAEPDELIMELEPEPDMGEQAEDEPPTVPENPEDPAIRAGLSGKTIVKIDGQIVPELDSPEIEPGSTEQLKPVKKNDIADAFRERGLDQSPTTSARRQISLEEGLTEDEEEEYAREKKRLLKKILIGAGAVLALVVVVLLIKPILFPGEPEQQPVPAPVTVPKPVKKKKPVKQVTQKPVAQEVKPAAPEPPQQTSEFFQDQKGWVSINLPAGFIASEQPNKDRTKVNISYGNDVTLALSIVPHQEDWNAEDTMYAAIMKMQENAVQKYATLKNAGCPGYMLHFASVQNQRPTQTTLYRFVCFNKSARLEVNSFSFRTPAGRELSQRIYTAIEESFFIYQ